MKRRRKPGRRTGKVEEAPAPYAAGSRLVSVRSAKDQLSALLERAANGEQIVITSDGQPKAMLVRYRPVLRGKPWKSLAAFRATLPMTPDSTPMIREERDSGY